MIEVLQFVFSSFWVWLGTWLLVGTVATGVGGLFRVRIGK